MAISFEESLILLVLAALDGAWELLWRSAATRCVDSSASATLLQPLQLSAGLGNAEVDPPQLC